MASKYTLSPGVIQVNVPSTAVQVGPAGNNVQSFLLQNQGTVTVYLGSSTSVAVSAAVQITAGASFNPDKHQAPRDDRNLYDLANYYIATRGASSVVAVLWHEITSR